MDLTIFKRNNNKQKLQLVVTDKMNVDDGKNRILFEISQLSEDNKKINTVEYFMEIEDCRYLTYLILQDKFQFREPFKRVRGKDGVARSFYVEKMLYKEKTPYYAMKIDKGSGSQHENGFTNFQKRESSLYYNLSVEDMTKLALNIRDRIMQRELFFLYLNTIKE